MGALRKIWTTTIGPMYNHFKMRLLIYIYSLKRVKIVDNIKTNDKIKVVFFVINLGMWKNDSLFKLLLDSEKFDPLIVSFLLPVDNQYYHRNIQKSLREYFASKGFPYLDMYNYETQELLDVKKITPCIAFYSQPYDLGYDGFKIRDLWNECLFAYIPYCFGMELIGSYHNLLLQNIAWKVFCPTDYHKKLGEQYAVNKGKNIFVTGLPFADNFLNNNEIIYDCWKQKDKDIKRVIWAPHHSINENSTLHYSNFLELADEMLSLCEEYEGRIQFAFKPHPRLITQLYAHPGWGEKRTNEYYSKWQNSSNTVFVDGNYDMLFKSSDAMIHDCSTFMGEYLYTDNPVMFVARDKVTDIMNDFGKSCFKYHYIGHNIQDIRSFLDNVVLKGDDSMREQRIQFKKSYLLPPQESTATENIFRELNTIFD